MGSGSSTHITEVESYGPEAQQEEEEDAVATPLRPAYAPTSQASLTTSPASCGVWSSVSQQRGASMSNPAGAPRPLDPSQTLWRPSQPAGPRLPFQPTPPQPYAHMGYYPVAGTGVVLSRVVRALEATPPPYLILPDHPNVPPSPPTLKHPPPPAPPNTAHTRRGFQYPGYIKPRSSPTLGAHLGTQVGRTHQSPTFGE